MLFEKKMINMRMSPLAMDFLKPKFGKRFMSNKTTRALQSKINLKFPFTSLEKKKEKMKPSIKQSIIDDFEKAYANNCN